MLCVVIAVTVDMINRVSGPRRAAARKSTSKNRRMRRVRFQYDLIDMPRTHVVKVTVSRRYVPLQPHGLQPWSPAF
jgi:hypothetical protein